MEVGGDVVTRDAARHHEESLVYAFGMVGESAALLWVALVVLRVKLAFASLMVVAAGANSQKVAARAHRGAPCTARPMEVASDACLRGATKGRKAALRSVRVMVVAEGAYMKEAEFAQRVCMVAPTFVWHMVVARDVLCLGALGVREVELIVVLGMVGVRGANMRGVGRAHREALITARPMVVGSVVVGMEDVRSLLEEGVGCVPPMEMLLQLQRLQVVEE